MCNYDLDMNKVFGTLGTIIGIIAFVFIARFLDGTVESLGVITYVDFGEERCVISGGGRYSYEDCSEGSSTDIGIAIMVLSLMISGYLGLAIAARRLNIFEHPNSKLLYFTIFICLVVYIFVATVLLQLDLYWISLIAMGGIGYLGWQYYEKTKVD
jgi:hypothetical protein